MAQLQQILLGLVVLLFVAVGTMQIWAYAVVQGGYQLTDLPLNDSLSSYVNQTNAFSGSLANATQSSTQQSPVVNPSTGIIPTVQAGIQAVSLSFSSITILTQIITTSSYTLINTFGFPGWMFGFGITFIVILITLVILSAIRGNPWL